MRWPWRRRRDEKTDHDAWDELSAWQAGMTDRGWRHWCWLSPPAGVPLELLRREWPTISVVESKDAVAGACNANGLWWRPCRAPVIAGIIYEADTLTLP